MTTEQREAIEFLEFYKQHCLKKEIENMDNYETIHDGDFVSKNLDTALSLIKEQQGQWEEIEGLKNINKNQSKDIKKAVDYTFELNKELERKDKQIDLMAERIEWLCKSNGILLDKEHDENFTQEDVKQYFERKVEDEK